MEQYMNRRKVLLILSSITILLLAVGCYGYFSTNHRKAETDTTTATEVLINKQQQQTESIKKPVLSPAQTVEAGQRQAILDFYSNYPKESSNKTAVDTYVTKLTTPTLLAQFNKQNGAAYNPLFCQTQPSPFSISIDTTTTTAQNSASYSVKVLSNGKLQSNLEVGVTSINNKILLSKVGCTGTI